MNELMANELEVMIPDIEGWAIVKYTNQYSVDNTEVYAEHIKGCRYKWDGKSANWCWQVDDAVPGEDNNCWQCKQPVPASIIALVALAEWD